MIQTTRIQLQFDSKFNNKIILDVVSTESRFFVLFKDSTLSEFELSGILKRTVLLENSKAIPNILYIDDMYV